MDANQFEALLRSAAKAHHAYEKATGKPDAEWEKWYARHMAEEYNAAREAVARHIRGARLARSRRHSDMHQL